MAEDDDLLEKADALMSRHRVFVAGASASPGDEDIDHDDIPVLTEVVQAAGAPAVDLAELRNAIAFEMEAWLDEELPKHVLRVLDGLTDQLIIQLSLQARAGLLPKLQNLLAMAQPPASTDNSGDSGQDAPV